MIAPTCIVVTLTGLVSGCAHVGRLLEDKYDNLPPVSSNPAMTGLQPRALQLFVEAKGDRYEARRAIAVSDDWAYTRHDISGAVTSRVADVWIAFEHKSHPGWCSMHLHPVFQESIGGSQWASLTLGKAKAGGKIDCGKIGQDQSNGNDNGNEDS